MKQKAEEKIAIAQVIEAPITPISEKPSSEDIDLDDRSDKVGKIFESSMDESE